MYLYGYYLVDLESLLPLYFITFEFAFQFKLTWHCMNKENKEEKDWKEVSDNELTKSSLSKNNELTNSK